MLCPSIKLFGGGARPDAHYKPAPMNYVTNLLNQLLCYWLVRLQSNYNIVTILAAPILVFDRSFQFPISYSFGCTTARVALFVSFLVALRASPVLSVDSEMDNELID
jgi:hypothetical protein